MSSLTQRGHPGKPAKLLSLSSLRHVQETQSDGFCLLRAVGQLWLRDVKIDWSKFHYPPQRRRVPLPTYPFERKRFWIERQPLNHPDESLQRRNIDDWFYAPIWKQSVLLSASSAVNKPSRWLLFVGDDCGLGTQLATQLAPDVITVRPGTKFAKLSDTRYEIDPRRPEDYESLLAAIGPLPGKLVHLWSISAGDESLEKTLDDSFYSLIRHVSFSVLLSARSRWKAADRLSGSAHARTRSWPLMRVPAASSTSWQFGLMRPASPAAGVRGAFRWEREWAIEDSRNLSRRLEARCCAPVSGFVACRRR